MIRLILTVIVLTIAIHAGIVTTATCEIPFASVTDPHSCTLAGDRARASASSNVLVQSPLAASDPLLVRLSQSVTADDSMFFPTYAKATASGEFSTQLTTAGPIRAGWLEYDFDETDGGSGSIAYVGGAYGVVIGNTTVYRCIAGSSGWFGLCEPSWGTAVRLPITLGQSFALLMYQNESTRADLLVNLILDTSLKIRLFEQDGTTAVALMETPEPGTAMLLAAALGTVLLISRRRRTAT